MVLKTWKEQENVWNRYYGIGCNDFYFSIFTIVIYIYVYAHYEHSNIYVYVEVVVDKVMEYSSRSRSKNQSTFNFENETIDLASSSHTIIIRICHNNPIPHSTTIDSSTIIIIIIIITLHNEFCGLFSFQNPQIPHSYMPNPLLSVAQSILLIFQSLIYCFFLPTS